MITKPIDALSATDIVSLVANGVSERRSLEWKEELPGSADADRKEFLADVSSFANAVGGHIVYGVSETRDEAGLPTGIPGEAIGVKGNVGAETLRLESMVRDGIAPRVPLVRFRAVPGGTKGDFLVCWIPKSWQAPHMVTFKNSSRFYARGASGKYQLDVRQIREAFIGSETLREAVRRFRVDRLARIESGEASPTGTFYAPARVVVHAVPLATFDATERPAIDLSEVQPSGWHQRPHEYRRFNFDGVLSWTNARDDGCLGYVQVFRNGTIETVDAVGSLSRPDSRMIPSTSFEERLIGTVREDLRTVQAWGIGGPFLFMVTLLGVAGYRMGVSQWLELRDDGAPIDRDMVIVPELWVEESPAEDAVPRLLRETIDVVWQSAGFDRSPNFGLDGSWKAKD